MKLDIKVIPGSKKDLIKQENDKIKVYLSAPAVDGKANKSLLKVLSDHFGVKKRQITIIKGLKSLHKTVNISGH